MENTPHHIPDIIYLLGAAVVIVAFFRQLRLSPVLGFLVAGAAIGPHGFGFIQEVKEKAYIAEFGVVFLLFMIGLELSFKKLIEMRFYVLGLGGLQFVITSAIIAYIADYYLNDWNISLVIGGALALSSTAIVLQVLDERGERVGQVGRVSFAILLLQDLAVIPLIVLVQVLAQGDGADLTSELARTFLKALGAIVSLILIGKIVLRPLLSLIANTKSHELFIATTLLLALGASFMTEAAGLSLALGGFIAGLVLAETQFQKQVEVDIAPFKGILMGLFFMTVGMGFDVNELIRKLPEVLAYSAALIFLKAAIIFLICKVFKFGLSTSSRTGILLSQGSEFAFVLFGIATAKKLLHADMGQTLLLVVTTTMAITPMIYAISSYFMGRMKSFRKDGKSMITQTEDLEGHVVIIGFGWVGENLAKMLAMDNYSFVVVDTEAKRVKIGREMGMPVYYGDASRPEILKSLRIKQARAVIITIHDSKPVSRVIQTIKTAFPKTIIIARAKHIDNVEAMKKEGATIVIPEAYESAIQIGRAALHVIGAHENDIERLANKFRDSEMATVEKEFEKTIGELARE